jgi:hypothetical protein
MRQSGNSGDIQGLKALQYLLAFLLEIALLLTYGYAGFHFGREFLDGLPFGIGLPLLLAVGWGIWMAPRARKRLRSPWRQVVALLLFLSAAGLLYQAHHTNLAVAFAGCAVLYTILSLIWKN